jgi:hypothetical protein
MLERHDRPAGGSSSGLDTHSLLLSLAGLIDDELLGWSRELVAVGDSDYALELVTAAIAADRVRLPEAVHAGLRAGRHEPPGVELPEPEPAAVMTHSFLADPIAAGYPPAIAAAFPTQALHTLPARILRGCRLRLSWRLTPAGSAPVPVPHPVLLVETTDGTGADLIAYQMADLLWQAGVFASVEVFGADTPIGEYHRAALEASVPLADRDLPPAGAQLPAQSSAGLAAAAPGFGQDPLRTDPARTPTGTPAPAREPAARSPLPPADRVIAARASVPPGPGRPPAGSFAPPRGNPPEPTGPLSQRRPPAPQRPQRVGAGPHGSNEGGPVVSPPPVRRPGSPPAQPPPTHPGRPPRRPTEDMPDTSENTLRSPRQPLEDRDATGSTRRPH